MRLDRFITKQGSYTFPDQTSGQLLFGEVTPSTKRLAGMDGGFDEYRDRRAPQGIGNVRAEWWLTPEDRLLIRAQKDTAAKMLHYGSGRLFQFVEDTNDTARDLRWTRARINNLQMPENVRDMPHLRQRVTANFQAADPAWYGIEPNEYDDTYNEDKWYFFDHGLKFDTAGVVWGGPRRMETISNGDTLTVINSGSHPTRPIIRISGVSSTWLLGGEGIMLGDPILFLDGPISATPNIGMRRISYASEETIEEWQWYGTIESTDTLEINCQKFTVTHENSSGNINAYPDFYVTAGFGFFEIPPGEHQFQIFGTFATSADVEIYYHDAWY